MPSYFTHDIFGKEVLNRLDSYLTEKVDKDIFLVFCQSHDYLFYSFNRKVNELGHYAHKNNTQDYILNIISYIKDNNLVYNKELLGYLYGSICHFILDVTTHPFINMQSNELVRYNGYKGRHRLVEKYIDSIYYERYYGVKIYNKKENFNKINFSLNLCNCINEVYNKTYRMADVSELYLKSIKDFSRIYKYLYWDKMGIKMYIYRFLSMVSNYNLECLSLRYCDKNLNYIINDFDVLYNNALSECNNTISKIDAYFSGREITQLKKIIPNMNYSGKEL